MTDYNLGQGLAPQFQPPQLQSNPAMGLANVGEILGALVASGPQGAQQAAGRIAARDEGARQRAWNAFTRMQDMQFQAAQKQMDRNHDAAMRRMEHDLKHGSENAKAIAQLGSLMRTSPAVLQSFQRSNPNLAPADADATVWATNAVNAMGGQGALRNFAAMEPRTQAEAQLQARGITVDPDGSPTLTIAQVQRDEDNAKTKVSGLKADLDGLLLRGSEIAEIASVSDRAIALSNLESELAAWQDRYDAAGDNPMLQPGGPGDFAGLPGSYAGLSSSAIGLQTSLAVGNSRVRDQRALQTSPSNLDLSASMFAPEIVANPEVRDQLLDAYVGVHGNDIDETLSSLRSRSEEELRAVFGNDYEAYIVPLLDRTNANAESLLQEVYAGLATDAGRADAETLLSQVQRLARNGDRSVEIQSYTQTRQLAEATQLELVTDLGHAGLPEEELLRALAAEGIDLEDAIAGQITWSANQGARLGEAGAALPDQAVDIIYGQLLERNFDRETDEPIVEAAVLSRRIESMTDGPVKTALRQKLGTTLGTFFSEGGEFYRSPLHPDLGNFKLRQETDERSYGSSEKLDLRGQDIFDSLTGTFTVPSFATMGGDDADSLVTWQSLTKIPSISKSKKGSYTHATQRLRTGVAAQSPLAGVVNGYKVKAFEDLSPNEIEKYQEASGYRGDEFEMEYRRLFDALSLHQFAYNTRFDPSNDFEGYKIQREIRAAIESDPRSAYTALVVGGGMSTTDLFGERSGMTPSRMGFGPVTQEIRNLERDRYGSTVLSPEEVAAEVKRGEEIVADLSRISTGLIGDRETGVRGYEAVVTFDPDGEEGPEDLRFLDIQSLSGAQGDVQKTVKTLSAKQQVAGDERGFRGMLERQLALGILQHAAEYRVLNLSSSDFQEAIKSALTPIAGDPSIGLPTEAANRTLGSLEQQLGTAINSEEVAMNLFDSAGLMLGDLVADSNRYPDGDERQAAINASTAVFGRSTRDVQAMASNQDILEMRVNDITDPTVRGILEEVKGFDDLEDPHYKAMILWAVQTKASYAQ
jgi:hypothetical protein